MIFFKNMQSFSLAFVFAFVGLSHGMQGLGDQATSDAWSIISQVYPAAMGIFNDLKASDDDVASNEVDKTARATGSEILDSIFNLTREITSDMMSLDDTAENMADKACLTEVLKGLYQGAGILSNFLTSSTMESESTGPRAGAEEVIKGLWQSVAKILNSVRSAKSAGQAVMDTAV